MNTGITLQTVLRSKMIKPHMKRFPGRNSHHVTMLKDCRRSQSMFHSGTQWQWKQIYSMTQSLCYLQINIINAHNKINTDCYKILCNRRWQNFLASWLYHTPLWNLMPCSQWLDPSWMGKRETDASKMFLR
jgi:hypothetical protein